MRTPALVRRRRRLLAQWQPFARLLFRRPVPGWPCWQLQVGRLYVRLWQRGVTLWYDAVHGGLMVVTKEKP